MYVDGSSSFEESRGGVVIVSPEGVIAVCPMFRVSSTNNEVEYEALITGLGTAKELGLQDLKVYSDFQLVVGHIKDDCKARKQNRVKYLQQVKDLIHVFHSFEVQQIQRELLS